MKQFVCIILLSLISYSCEIKNEQVVLGHKKGRFAEYNEISFKNRFANNLKLINTDFTEMVIIEDSSYFIESVKINEKMFAPTETLQAIGILRDKIEDIIFYKHITYIPNSYNLLHHIEYPIEKDGRLKMMLFCFENYRTKGKMNTCFIKWSSLPTNIETLKYFDIPLPFYLWEINKTTDTITTNLSMKSIKMLYPDFEGVYIFKKYEKIILDYNYSTFDRSFFEHIEFVE